MVYIYIAATVAVAAADVVTDIANRMELEVQVKIWQPKELKILLIAICY